MQEGIQKGLAVLAQVDRHNIACLHAIHIQNFEQSKQQVIYWPVGL